MGDKTPKVLDGDRQNPALDFLRLLQDPTNRKEQDPNVVKRMQDLIAEYVRTDASLDKLKPKFDAVIKDADTAIAPQRQNELRTEFAKLNDKLDNCLQPPPWGILGPKAIAELDKAIRLQVATVKPDAARAEVLSLCDKLATETNPDALNKARERLKTISPELLKMVDQREAIANRTVPEAIAEQEKAIKAGIAALKPDAVRTEAQQLYDKFSKETDPQEATKLKTRLKEINPEIVRLIESNERLVALDKKEKDIVASIAKIEPPAQREAFDKLVDSFAASKTSDERERVKEAMIKISPETVKLLEQRERLFAPYISTLEKMDTLKLEFNRSAIVRHDYAQLLLTAGQKADDPKLISEAQNLFVEAFRRNVDPEMSRRLWDAAIAAGVKPESLNTSKEQLADAAAATDKLFIDTEGLQGARKSAMRIEGLKLIRPDYDKALELADEEIRQATKVVGKSYETLTAEKKTIEKQYQELDDKRHKLIEAFSPDDKALYKKWSELPIGDPASETIAKQLIDRNPEFAATLTQMQNLTIDAVKVDSQMAYLEDAALARFQISHVMAEAYHKAGNDEEARRVMKTAFDSIPKDLQPVLALLKGDRQITSLMSEIGLTDPSLDSVQGLLAMAAKRNREGDFKGASEYWDRAINNAEALNKHPEKIRAEIEELQANLRKGTFKDTEGERPINAAYIQKAHERIQELLQISRAPMEAHTAYAVALMEREQYADAEKHWIAAKAATAKDKLPADLMRIESSMLVAQADESQERRQKGWRLDNELAKIVQTFTPDDRTLYDKLTRLEPGSTDALAIQKQLATRYPSFEEPYRLRQALAKDEIKNLQEDVEARYRAQALDLQELAKAPVKVRYSMALFYLAGGVDQNGKPLGDQFKLAAKEPHFPTAETGKELASKIKGGDPVPTDKDKRVSKMRELTDDELAKLTPKERDRYEKMMLLYKGVDQKVTQQEKIDEAASKTVGNKPFLAPDKAFDVVTEAINIQIESGAVGAEGQRADAELKALKALVALNAPEELQRKMELHGGIWKNAKADAAAGLTGIAVTALILAVTKGKALKYIEPVLGETGANAARWTAAVGLGATTSVGVRSYMMSDDPNETFGDSALHGLGSYGAAGTLLLAKHGLSRYYYGAFTEEKVAELAVKAIKSEGAIATAPELAAMLRSNGLTVSPGLAQDLVKVIKADGAVASATELAALMRSKGLAIGPELAQAAKAEADYLKKLHTAMEAEATAAKADKDLVAAGRMVEADATAAANARIKANITPLVEARTTSLPPFNEAAVRSYLAGAQGQQGACLLRALFPSARLEAEGVKVATTPWSKFTKAGGTAMETLNPFRPIAADTIPGFWAYNSRAVYQGLVAGMAAQTIQTESGALSDWRQGKLDLEGKPITPASALAARLDFSSGKGLLNNMLIQSLVMAPLVGGVSPGAAGYKGYNTNYSESPGAAPFKYVNARVLEPGRYAARSVHSFINPGAPWGKVPVMQEVLRSAYLPALYTHGLPLLDGVRGNIQSNLSDDTQKAIGYPPTDMQKEQRYKDLLGKTKKPIVNKPNP